MSTTIVEPVQNQPPDTDYQAKLTALEAELQKSREASSAQAARLQELEQTALRQPPPQNQPPPKPDPFTDPEGFARQTAREELTPLIISQLQTNVYLARQRASADPKLAKVFARFGSEIDALMKQEPLHNQANEAVWRNAAKSVTFDHFDDLEKERSEGKGWFLESPASGAPPKPEPAKHYELAEPDMKVARALGIANSPERLEGFRKRREATMLGVSQ